MHKKIQKILAILCATVLTLPIVQILPVSITHASMTLTLSKYSGNAAEKILVSGVNASPGILLRLYWDRAVNETKLNETRVKGNGNFSCYVTIPKDVAGSHWVIADAASAEFLIEPKIILNPRIGLPYDTVNVNGTGFAAERRTTVAFGNKTVAGEWDWSKNMTTTPSTVRTDTKGSFNSTFKVPDLDYGDYIMNATDENGNFAEANFTIGATITLTPTKGSCGTLVTINGKGFTEVANKAIKVTIDGTTAPVVENIKTRGNGSFTGQFIIPTLDEGEYTVTAVDEIGISGNAPFSVTNKTEISLTPRAAAQDIEVTIEGTGFTNIANTKVTMRFGVLTLKDFYTNSTGGFKGTFNVPSLPIGIYDIIAKDTNALNATAPFIIAVTELALAPESGPTGTIIRVIGYGYTPGAKADLTLNTTVIIEDITVTELEAGITLVVPTVPAGVYTLTATDDEGFTASATFEVTAATVLTLTPSESPHSTTVSVEAGYFTHKAGTPLTFTIENSTWEMPLTVDPASPWTAVETDETGSFIGTFEIPDYSTIALGDYIVKAEDENGLVAETPLSIILPTVYIGTRSSEYMPGDTVSFYVSTTLRCNFTIGIMGPLGSVRELIISDADWQTIDGWEVVPYEKVSFTLPSDAELGLWNWSATLILVEASGSFTVVKPTVERLYEEMTLLRNRISSLEQDLTSLSGKLDEISSRMATLNEETLSSLRNEISEMQRDLETLKNHISSAEQAARNAQQTASNLTTITYIVLAISIAAAIAAILAFIAIIELGRMVTSGTKP